MVKYARERVTDVRACEHIRDTFECIFNHINSISLLLLLTSLTCFNKSFNKNESSTGGVGGHRTVTENTVLYSTMLSLWANSLSQ